MNDFVGRFERAIEPFPENARHLLREIPDRAGRLGAAACRGLTRILGIGIEDLMVKLLPVAGLYVDARISRFGVGAAARAAVGDGGEEYDLFLGANMEFQGRPLYFTIHAEQSAAMNAWSRGAGRLESIAISEPPCGFCRQFLQEFEGAGRIRVITPSREKGRRDSIDVNRLSALLPMAFGPGDLQIEAGLGAGFRKGRKLKHRFDKEDPVFLEALEAAETSHAPYTGNLAGCAVRAEGGRIFSGGYVETAAFNPTLTPIQTALLSMKMAAPGGLKIRRAVLVERPGTVRQRTAVEDLLAFTAPGIELEYYEVG